MAKYCRIINDEVVEWNVSEIHIRNRGHKLEDYSPVRETLKPGMHPWEYAVERKPNLVNGIPEQQWEVVQYALDQYKDMRKAELKKKTLDVLQKRHKLDTSLGFPVDASYTTLLDFQSAKNLGLTFLRDANNVTQTVTQDDWDVIIQAIQTMGVQFKENKWNIQDTIDAIEVGDDHPTEADALQAVYELGFGMLDSYVDDDDPYNDPT